MKYPWKTKVVNEKGCRAIVMTDGTVRLKPYKGGIYEGEYWSGPRLSHHLNNSPIPRVPPKEAGQSKYSHKIGIILHSCDNPWCVENTHLREGTASDNAKDNAKRNENHMSPEMIEKRRIASIGIKRTEEACRNISISLMGHPVSEEARHKMSVARLGKPLPEEVKKKMSISSMGNKGPLGHKQTEEHKKKGALGRTGTKRTDEQKKNLTNGQFKHWDKVKAAGCRTYSEYKQFQEEIEYLQSPAFIHEILDTSPLLKELCKP